MDFFNKMLNNVTSQAVDKLADKVKSSVGEVAKDMGINLDNDSKKDDRASTKVESAPVTSDATTVTNKIKKILAENFLNYQVKKDVSVTELGGEGRPYTLGVYKNGKLYAVIMVTDHNRDNNQAFKGAKLAAQEKKVVFLNFYTHYPNEDSYLKNRLKENL